MIGTLSLLYPYLQGRSWTKKELLPDIHSLCNFKLNDHEHFSNTTIHFHRTIVLKSCTELGWIIVSLCAYLTWWRLYMGTFSASLGTGEFTSQKPVVRSFDVFLICTWTNCSANNRDTGDLRRHCAHFDVTVVNNDQRNEQSYMSTRCALLYGRGSRTAMDNFRLAVIGLINWYIDAR